MGTCEIQAPIFTRSGKAGATAHPGAPAILTTSVDGVTATFIEATSGIIHGVFGGVRVGGGTQEVFAASDIVSIFKQGSEAIVCLTGAVTDVTVPLKLSGSGFTPVTTNKDVFNAIPLETGASGTYIRAYITSGYYNV